MLTEYEIATIRAAHRERWIRTQRHLRKLLDVLDACDALTRAHAEERTGDVGILEDGLHAAVERVAPKVVKR